MTKYFASSTGKYHLVREDHGNGKVTTQCGRQFTRVDSSLDTDASTFLKPTEMEQCSLCNWEDESNGK